MRHEALPKPTIIGARNSSAAHATGAQHAADLETAAKVFRRGSLRCDCAKVDDPLDAGALGGGGERLGGRLLSHEQPMRALAQAVHQIVGHLAASQRPFDIVRLSQISLPPRPLWPLTLHIGRIPTHTAHMPADCLEDGCQASTDKTGCAGK